MSLEIRTNYQPANLRIESRIEQRKTIFQNQKHRERLFFKIKNIAAPKTLSKTICQNNKHCPKNIEVEYFSKFKNIAPKTLKRML